MTFLWVHIQLDAYTTRKSACIRQENRDVDGSVELDENWSRASGLLLVPAKPVKVTNGQGTNVFIYFGDDVSDATKVST